MFGCWPQADGAGPEELATLEAAGKEVVAALDLSKTSMVHSRRILAPIGVSTKAGDFHPSGMSTKMSPSFNKEGIHFRT